MVANNAAKNMIRLPTNSSRMANHLRMEKESAIVMRATEERKREKKREKGRGRRRRRKKTGTESRGVERKGRWKGRGRGRGRGRRERVCGGGGCIPVGTNAWIVHHLVVVDSPLTLLHEPVLLTVGSDAGCSHDGFLKVRVNW